MKYLPVIVFVMGLLQGCDLFKKETNYTPLIPNNTPFIVSILEATDDTVHHYPEVFVGYLSQPKGFQAKLVWKIPGIWWPVTNVQVTRPATVMDLKRVPDTEAKVIIKGPLNKPKETKVRFTHVGGGVYGNTNYELPLLYGEKYRLSVTMSDGRRYTATTKIPDQFKWSVPDTAYMQLKLKKDVSGKYYEQNKEDLFLTFSVSPQTEYITYQENSEYDYKNFNTPKGGFLFDNRGNYLRFGAAYGVFDASDQPQIDAIQIGWLEYIDSSPIRMSEKWWLTMNQLNKPLSRYYYPVFPRFATSDGGRMDRQFLARGKVVKEYDNSYLFNYMSNIKKITEDGQVINKNEAFGVFGAYSVAYERLTVIPKRSWNPDTVDTYKNK